MNISILRAVIYICLVINLASGKANAQWGLKSENMGVQIFSQERSGSPFHLVKAQMTIEVSLDKLAEVMRKIEEYDEWMFGCVKSKVIEKDQESHFLLYYVHETPWPFNYRDVVLSINTKDRRDEGWFAIDMMAIDNVYSMDEDYVRMAEMEGHWRFESLGADKSRVTFTLVVDPAGDVPIMFVNSGNETVVYESFLGLQRRALGERFEELKEKYEMQQVDELISSK